MLYVLRRGSKAILITSKWSYRVTKTAHPHFVLDIVPELLVRHVHNTIIQHGREKYDFGNVVG